VASGARLTLVSSSPETQRELSSMSNDDVLYGYRLRLFALDGEIGVRPG